MTLDEARHRIQATVSQFGPQAAFPLDLIINEVRSAHGHEAANLLIDEFDLELEYNITPFESEGGNF